MNLTCNLFQPQFSAAFCEEGRLLKYHRSPILLNSTESKTNLYLFTLNTNVSAHKGGSNADIRYIRKKYVNFLCGRWGRFNCQSGVSLFV